MRYRSDSFFAYSQYFREDTSVIYDKFMENGSTLATSDAKDNPWYFNGEKVRFFRDVLTSNGESLTNGKFKGTMRTFNGNGTIDIYTVRDFSNLDASGNGTLTGIEKFSQEEFDERTWSSIEVQTSSGECTVVQE